MDAASHARVASADPTVQAGIPKILPFARDRLLDSLEDVQIAQNAKTAQDWTVPATLGIVKRHAVQVLRDAIVVEQLARQLDGGQVAFPRKSDIDVRATT